MLSKATNLLLGVIALLAIFGFRKYLSWKAKKEEDRTCGDIDAEPFQQKPVGVSHSAEFDPSDEPLGKPVEASYAESASLNVHDISPIEEYLDPATSPQRKAELAQEFRRLGYKVSGTSSQTEGSTIPDGIDEQYERPFDIQ